MLVGSHKGVSCMTLALIIALPFLGRTVGTAAWIWQIMDDLQQATDATEVRLSPVSAAAKANSPWRAPRSCRGMPVPMLW